MLPLSNNNTANQSTHKTEKISSKILNVTTVASMYTVTGPSKKGKTNCLGWGSRKILPRLSPKASRRSSPSWRMLPSHIPPHSTGGIERRSRKSETKKVVEHAGLSKSSAPHKACFSSKAKATPPPSTSHNRSCYSARPAAHATAATQATQHKWSSLAAYSTKRLTLTVLTNSTRVTSVRRKRTSPPQPSPQTTITASATNK